MTLIDIVKRDVLVAVFRGRAAQVAYYDIGSFADQNAADAFQFRNRAAIREAVGQEGMAVQHNNHYAILVRRPFSIPLQMKLDDRTATLYRAANLIPQPFLAKELPFVDFEEGKVGVPLEEPTARYVVTAAGMQYRSC